MREEANDLGDYDAKEEKRAEILEDLQQRLLNLQCPIPQIAEGRIPLDGPSQSIAPVPAPENISIPLDTSGVMSEPSCSVDTEFTIMKCTRIPRFSPFNVSVCLCGTGILPFLRKERTFPFLLKAAAGVTFAGALFYGLTRAYNSIVTKLNAQKNFVCLLKPSSTIQDMVDHSNRSPMFCPRSLLVQRAVLVGTYVTESKEARPVRHQAARVDKRTYLQAWNIERNGLRIPIIVNGNLLTECLSDLHSDDKNAANAALRQRTKNVCHLNLPSPIQAVVNPNTYDLARFILGVDF